MNAKWFRSVWTCGLALAGAWAAAEDSKLVVRDVNVSFAAKGTMNDRSSFRGTLPGVVLSQRPAPAKSQDSIPQPLGVLTFEGTPTEKVDVLLEYDGSARMLARWPHVEQRSTRTLWRNADLVNSKTAPTSPFPANSWLNPLRSADRLSMSFDQKIEKFVLYDMSLRAPNGVELEAAETGYKARNAGTSAIHDITVYRPVGDGKFRAAYVATIPGAAKPAAAPDAATPPMPRSCTRCEACSRAGRRGPSSDRRHARACSGGPSGESDARSRSRTDISTARHQLGWRRSNTGSTGRRLGTTAGCSGAGGGRDRSRAVDPEGSLVR